jgi:hypothetical protein
MTATPLRPTAPPRWQSRPRQCSGAASPVNSSPPRLLQREGIGAVARGLGRPGVAAVVRAERIVAAQVLERQPGHPLLHRPQRHALTQFAASVRVATQQPGLRQSRLELNLQAKSSRRLKPPDRRAAPFRVLSISARPLMVGRA